MKIALVILHADPRRGGAERYTVDLARGLKGRGHQVSIVATTFPVMFSDITSVHLATSEFTRTMRYRSFLSQFDNHLKIAPYDIVHAMLPMRRCDLYHPHAGLAAEALEGGKARSFLPRMVSRVMNLFNPRRRCFASIERRLLRKTHKPIVICLSEYVKQSVRAYYPMPDDKLATLFNAVDLKQFDPAARPDAGKTMREKFKIAPDVTLALMVAQDFARKGLAETLQAMAVNRATNSDGSAYKLLVVGRGDTGTYARRAAQLGLSDRVIFAGATDDVYAAYQAADFFVLPTKHDPCSLVVLEALAMGLPVISTKQNGATEIMTDGVHGSILPDPSDRSALAAAMQKWAKKDARATASEACLALRPRLSFETHLDELQKIYDRAPGHWS